jgi:hypothetical protein
MTLQDAENFTVFSKADSLEKITALQLQSFRGCKLKGKIASENVFR